MKKKKFNDKDWAKKVFKKAMDKADEFDEFRNIAESIHKRLGDKKWATEAYKKAEENAEFFIRLISSVISSLNGSVDERM